MGRLGVFLTALVERSRLLLRFLHVLNPSGLDLLKELNCLTLWWSVTVLLRASSRFLLEHVLRMYDGLWEVFSSDSFDRQQLHLLSFNDALSDLTELFGPLSYAYERPASMCFVHIASLRSSIVDCSLVPRELSGMGG